MTECEWLECADPASMIDWVCFGGPSKRLEAEYFGTLADELASVSVPTEVSDRKIRLFAVACTRGDWHLLTDDLEREAVEVGESYADGLAHEPRRNALAEALTRAKDEAVENHDFWQAAWKLTTYFLMSSDVKKNVLRAAEAGGKERKCRLLRDVLGSPFRDVSINPTWLTPTVSGLAAAAYDKRHLPSGDLDAVRLSILADALEDAGCASELIDHLRGPGPHVRGCWALDLLLGKK